MLAQLVKHVVQGQQDSREPPVGSCSLYMEGMNCTGVFSCGFRRSLYVSVSLLTPAVFVVPFLPLFGPGGSSENQLLGLLITFTSWFSEFQLLPLIPY